jgi:hypothetical protein
MLGDRTTVCVQPCFALAFRHSVTGLGLAYSSDKAGRHRYTGHDRARVSALHLYPDIAFIEKGSLA